MNERRSNILFTPWIVGSGRSERERRGGRGVTTGLGGICTDSERFEGATRLAEMGTNALVIYRERR